MTLEPLSKEARDPGPPLPEVEMHLHTPKSAGVGRVVRTERCTASGKSASFVRHVEIDVSGTDLAGRFRAGQSFGVLPPGEDDRGRPHSMRLYSIASPTAGEDGEGNVLATTVKRVIDEDWKDHTLKLGLCSNYLCNLQEGDEVRVTGPNGKRFLLPKDPGAHDYVFIATGTGIAPFRGMLTDLFAAGYEGSVTLIMGVPHRTDLLYHDDLEKLASEHANFTYLPVLSRENQDDGSPPCYVQNKLADPGAGLAEVLSSERSLVYLCGLAGMEVGVFQSLARMLEGAQLSRLLQVDAEAAGPIDDWNRKLVNRALKPTRRMFLEVY